MSLIGAGKIQVCAIALSVFGVLGVWNMNADTRRRNGIGRLSAVPFRFPLPTLVAIAFTAYALSLSPNTSQLSYLLPVVFLWTIAAASLAEAHNRSRIWGFLVAVFGVAIIFLLNFFSKTLYLHLPSLFAALALVVALVAFVGTGRSEDQFWHFNYRLTVGSGVTVLAALVFLVGVILILDNFRHVFPFNVKTQVGNWVLLVGFGLLIPVMWLSFIPDRFDETMEDAGPTDLLGRVVSVVGKFILIPLVLIYAVIPHAHAVMILSDLDLPKGRLAWSVISFGVLLVVAVIAVFPKRNGGGPLIRFFWRIWPWLLPVPVALLFLALGARVQQYGWTEQRYFLALVGVWLAALFVTQILPNRWRDLRVSVALLIGLLLFAAVGPWSMTGFPTRMFAAELDLLLAKTGIVKDGRLVDGHNESEKLSEDDYRIFEITDYLADRRQLNLLRPIFEGAKNNPFIPDERVNGPKKTLLDRFWNGERETVPGKTENELSHDILVRLGYTGYRARPVYRDLEFSTNHLIFLTSEQHRIFVGSYNLRIVHTSKEEKEDSGGYEISILESVVQVLETKTGRVSRFEVGKSRELVMLLLKSKEDGPTTSVVEEVSVSHKPVVIKPVAGDLNAELHVTDAAGWQIAEDEVDIHELSFWIAVAR